MSIKVESNNEAFELIVKYGLHVKLSENSQLNKRYASVGYPVNEYHMEYVHEELTGNPQEDVLAYRAAIYRAAQAMASN